MVSHDTTHASSLENVIKYFNINFVYITIIYVIITKYWI
jgi:hypothetical protein